MKMSCNFITTIILLLTSIAHAQDQDVWENKKESLYIRKAGPSQKNEYGVITLASSSITKNEHILIRVYTFGTPITGVKNTVKNIVFLYKKDSKKYEIKTNEGEVKIQIIKNTYPPTYKIDISATIQSSETGEEIKISESITTTPNITCQENQKFSETNAGNTIPNFCLRIAGLTQQPNTSTAPLKAE